MQPGPIYFKTPGKCAIFRVMCEGLRRQVDFLIDEAADTGKGENAIISYVHYYFNHHGLGDKDAHLNADNYTNKINCFLWYLVWRILMKLHQSIKRSYKVTFVSSLFEFARLVEKSSNTGVNKAQLVEMHDGRVIDPVYYWNSFLSPYFK